MDQGSVEMRERPKAYMIQEEGVVKEVRGDMALVLTDRKEQCGQCMARGCSEMLGGGKKVGLLHGTLEWCRNRWPNLSERDVRSPPQGSRQQGKISLHYQ
jgi:hypothetical protein